MEKVTKKRRRGPYGRHKYDQEIDYDAVEKQWLEHRFDEPETALAEEEEEVLDHVNEGNAVDGPFSMDDVRKTANKEDESELSVEDLVKGTDYGFSDCDDDSDDCDDVKLDPPLPNEADKERDSDSEPLFPGSNVSVGAFMLLLAVFASKYNLIGDATQQLLNIISFVLPTGHKVCSTLHEFKKYFKTLKNPLVSHYYCSYCSGFIEDTNITKCPYEECSHLFNKKTANYFLEMPIQDQIKNLFKQEGFHEMLQVRFGRRTTPGVYEDIYDGNVYRSQFDNGGFLSNPNNISFSFNTDGASVFKSSNVSVWPLFLVINELPYKIRMKKENMILASLWFGDKKPSMSTFLKPFHTTMTKMYQGISCVSPFLGSFICKAVILCGTADLPARSLLCNHIQYNGAFSCWKCEQEGISAEVGKGHTRVFPFDNSNFIGPKRTPENVRHNAHKALEGSDIVKGIKGPSWFLFFPCFNIVSGIAIDYMHGVLLGVEKLLTELWFSKKYSSHPYSLHKSIDKINGRLLSIRPTLDITRLPRSLQDLQHWKASEFRSFLLFYSAPVLYGILDNERFVHYLLLVNSMHILLRSGSSERQVKCAENMLLEFCKGFKDMYDECFMRLNVHQLMHLPDCVRDLGPLFTSSCFSFENKNGVLLKLIRGTQNIDNQIVTGVSFVQKLPELKSKCIESGSQCEKIYNAIENATILKRNITVEKGLYILGGISSKTLENDERDALQMFLGAHILKDKYLSFNRIEFNDTLIYGLSYTRMVKRNNSVIEYKLNANTVLTGFGQVRYFINNDEVNFAIDSILAFVEPLNCLGYDDETNILRVQMLNSVKIVRVKDIVSGCMLIAFPNEPDMFVCRFPNRLESD